MNPSGEMSKADRKELEQDFGKSKRQIFREYNGHKNINKQNLWVKYIYGWTDAVASSKEVDIETVSTLMEMNDIAQKVHKEKLSLKQGKNLIDGLRNEN